VSVLVDTSVWSLAFRRRPARLSDGERRRVDEWSTLVIDNQALIIGMVRQETLSGIRRAEDFESLRTQPAGFDDLPVGTADHERAAAFFNQCRATGIAATAVDMLIGSVASCLDVAIFTTDADFERYAQCLPIRLYRPRRPQT